MTSFIASTIFALAAASTAAALPPGFPNRRRDNNKFFDDDQPPTNTKIEYHESNAYVECSSAAFSDAYEGGRNAMLEATAEVYVNLCGEKPSILRAVEELEGVAESWAQATAQAKAECKTKVTGGGVAEGCSFSKAQAEGFKKNFGNMFSDALAVVSTDRCDCGNVETEDAGFANIMEDFVTKVFAKAEAEACSSENGSSDAKIFVDCYAQIFAQLYAKATAEVVLKGECTANQKASSKIEAFVNSKVYEFAECMVLKDSNGDGSTDDDGEADASVKKPF